MGNINRKVIQVFSAIAMNLNIKGFAEGNIYKGPIKKACVPGLNCYSCPGAVGSCPIGSLQGVLGSGKYKFSFYVIGFLILVGTLIGRLVCGFLCPFGLIQEILHKIPTPKFKLPNWTKYIKYIVLAVFVIILPLLWVESSGIASPAFCKYICPAGTLEGGIPLLSIVPGLSSAIGFLFAWKMLILVLTIILAIYTFRPFCKVLCPLGAIYALFNPISIYKYKIDMHKCVKCKKCANTCKMGVEVYKKPNSLECIRCGECKTVCPTQAIKSEFKISK